jgi:hypothetical protein
VAVRTQQREVFAFVVLPISVDVLDLDWYPPGARMAFIPAARRTLFSKLHDQIAPLKRDDRIRSRTAVETSSDSF